MKNWMMLGKPQEVEDKKTSIFKDYIFPLGALLIPALAFLAQNTSPWWGSLAIAAYVVIVVVFLVVPAIIRGVKKWKSHSTQK
jgi:Ca2+/Na+ antiporter